MNGVIESNKKKIYFLFKILIEIQSKGSSSSDGN